MTTAKASYSNFQSETISENEARSIASTMDSFVYHIANHGEFFYLPKGEDNEIKVTVSGVIKENAQIIEALAAFSRISSRPIAMGCAITLQKAIRRALVISAAKAALAEHGFTLEDTNQITSESITNPQGIDIVLH